MPGADLIAKTTARRGAATVSGLPAPLKSMFGALRRDVRLIYTRCESPCIIAADARAHTRCGLGVPMAVETF